VIRRSLAAASLGLLAACAAGGVPTSSGAGGGVTVDVNLTLDAPVKTTYGQSGGDAPPITNVAVGTQLRFVNTDSFTHTATLIRDATQFPADSPFGIGAQMQRGSNLSGGFSSGAMHPGSSSQTITADRAGTYLFGCFFHYDAPMRATILAQ
jgi:plastocyanin